MKLTQGKIALYVGLVFASGIVLGAFGFRLYAVSTTVKAKNSESTAASFRAKYMLEMQSRLDLTDQQFSQLNAIMDETRARMDEFNRSVANPELRRIRNEQIDKIREMLTPDQKPKYEQLRKERDERARKGAPIVENPK